MDLSSEVRVSALAIIGIKFTFLWIFFIKNTSSGRRLRISRATPCGLKFLTLSQLERSNIDNSEPENRWSFLGQSGFQPEHTPRNKNRCNFQWHRSFRQIKQNGSQVRRKTCLFSLLMKSPNPGVSITFKRNVTPFSSISKKIRNDTCYLITPPIPMGMDFSVTHPSNSCVNINSDSNILLFNRLFSSVDLPVRPVAPSFKVLGKRPKMKSKMPTNDHQVKIKSACQGLAMYLVRIIPKSNLLTEQQVPTHSGE